MAAEKALEHPVIDPVRRQTPPPETRQKSNGGRSTSQQARQPDQGRSGNSQTAGHSAAGPQNTEAQLPLSR